MGDENYNLLPLELLTAGYTVDHHPDYVKICSSQWGKHPLENLAGEFKYLRWYAEQFVYQTGCSKHVMGNEILKYKEYSDTHNGKSCYHHMYYNERTQSWNLRYELYDCVRRCHSSFCPLFVNDFMSCH